MKKVLLLIIILAGILRLTFVNWDSFGAFHPDERNISWAVTRIHFFSQMDPKFFAYGGLPIYLYRALGEAVVVLTHNPIWLFDWGHIAVIGRHVSAILSTMSVGLIFFVGTAYFSSGIGLLSSIFLAFSPWAIREAHFQTTETMLVFFVLLLLLLAKKITTRRTILLGVVWGLAMAAKTTAILFGVIPLISIGKHVRRQILLLTVAALVFFCFSPYTILDFQHFNESMTYESGVALGKFTVPYTLQFVGKIPYLYQLVTMGWQTGILVIVGFVGLIALIILGVRKRNKKLFVFLLFPFIYFGWVGTWFAKFSRYNVLLFPFLTIAAAWTCMNVLKKSRALGIVLTSVVIISTMLWGLANFQIYLHQQTKIVATNWIMNHIPPNSIIYTEHWNDGLPLDIPNAVPYHRELLNVYDEPDDSSKAMYYAEKLSVGDYIIFSTRRIWATMPGLGQKYPVTSVFYKKLLDGTLGYTEVAVFTSYPGLLGIEINDDSAEESIQVFDHPTVRIFQNSQHLTKNALYSILGGR